MPRSRRPGRLRPREARRPPGRSDDDLRFLRPRNEYGDVVYSEEDLAPETKPRNYAQQDWKLYFYAGIGLVAVAAIVIVIFARMGGSGRYHPPAKPPRPVVAPRKVTPKPAATNPAALAGPALEEFGDAEEALLKFVGQARDKFYPTQFTTPAQTTEQILGLQKGFSALEAPIDRLDLGADEKRALHQMLQSAKELLVAQLANHLAGLNKQVPPKTPAEFYALAQRANESADRAKAAFKRLGELGSHGIALGPLREYARQQAARPPPTRVAVAVSTRRPVSPTSQPTPTPTKPPPVSKRPTPTPTDMFALPIPTFDIIPLPPPPTNDGTPASPTSRPAKGPPQWVVVQHPKFEGEGVICHFTFNNLNKPARQLGSITYEFKDGEDNLICRGATVFLAKDFSPRWENVMASAGTVVTAGSVMMEENGSTEFVAVGFSADAAKATRAYVRVTTLDGNEYTGQGGEGLDISYD